MGKGSSAPPPPDPRQTSAAQTGTNVGTAIANSMLGMVDQYTPYGNLTYSLRGGGQIGDIPGIQEIQSTVNTPQEPFTGNPDDRPVAGPTLTTTSQFQVGDEVFGSRSEAEQYRNGLMNDTGAYYNYTDPFTGETYTIPRFESTVELNPQQQATLEANQRAENNLANLADERSDFLLDYLPQTESLTDEIGNRLYDMGAQRLDPRFRRQEDDLRTRLTNQGIRAGTEAYDREMELFNNSRNDAYNQLMLQGRGQALTEINTPINQITALLSGSQVTNPQVQMQQPAQIPTTDNAAIINNNYQQQLAQWQQNQASRGSSLSALGGLFQTGIGAFGTLSDERAKTDKKKVAETKDGMGIYSFKYKGSDQTQLGLMAQEVKKKKPRAVMQGGDGLMRVNYERALG